MPDGRRLIVILRCKAILFDLDGVLVDSAECVEVVWRQWAEENQLDADRVVKYAHGRPTLETIQIVAPHLVAELEVATLGARESIRTAGVYEIPGAREFVASLPGKWAVVTSGIRSVAMLRIRHTNLPVRPVLICADDISAGKSHPEGYLTAPNLLGVDPVDSLVVEDAPPGIEAARRAGMQAVSVLGTYPSGDLSQAAVIARSVTSLSARLNDTGMDITVVPAA